MTGNTDLSLLNSKTESIQSAEQVLERKNIPYEGYDEFDMIRIERRLSAIKAMAQFSSSGLTIYDLRRKVHIYASENFYKLFGYDIRDQNEIDNDVFDQKIHPDDLADLTRNGREAMIFLAEIQPTLRLEYKMINEYRIVLKEGTCINVTEQHQIIEQDASGHSWLSLGIIDLSPNQSTLQRVNFQIHNFITGEMITLQSKAKINTISLTLREREILKMISDGKLSKEISWLLKISVHTVNTHRQHILEKLDVNNSIEAIYTAKEKGIIR